MTENLVNGAFKTLPEYLAWCVTIYNSNIFQYRPSKTPESSSVHELIILQYYREEKLASVLLLNYPHDTVLITQHMERIGLMILGLKNIILRSSTRLFYISKRCSQPTQRPSCPVKSRDRVPWQKHKIVISLLAL
jgi:hypothetical protein